MIACIYTIRSKARPDKIYIGSSKDFGKRRRAHLNALRLNKHANYRLQRLYNLYGEPDLVFDILEIVEDANVLIKKEQHYIDTLYPVLNILKIAGSWVGAKHTAESRAKMRLAAMGNKSHLGKKHSPEAIEKMRKAAMGKQTTLGLKKSDEFRKRMAEVAKITKNRFGKGAKIVDLYTGEEFPCMRIAAEKYGINYGSLRAGLSAGKGLFKNFKQLKHG